MSWISLNDAASMSFTREVALLQSATVLIAHNGAISANLILLPDRAVAIVSDIFDVPMQRSRQQDQDGHLYSALGYIRVLYYMVKPEEIPDHANYHWPNADTACNITRMVRLVEIGLRHTARAFKLKDRGPKPVYSVASQEDYDGTSLPMPAPVWDESHGESPDSVESALKSRFFGSLGSES
jgi:hypothetical protein